MHPLRGPGVQLAVEEEEGEEGHEDCRHPAQVGGHQQPRRGRGERVVEAEAVDVDTEEEAAAEVEKVVDGQLLGDGVVQGGGAGRGGVEPGGEDGLSGVVSGGTFRGYCHGGLSWWKDMVYCQTGLSGCQDGR